MQQRNDEPICLYEDEALDISHVPGTSGTAVISFAGIGMKVGPIKTHEFSKSLEGVPHDVYFVRDKVKRWYLGVSDKVVDILNTHMRSRGVTDTACLGHSMGAFGAIYFAPDLYNCNRVIAFSPQSTINSKLVPWETRWSKARKEIPEGEGLDAVPKLSPDISYWILLGADNVEDHKHLQRFLDRNVPTVTAIGVHTAEHSAALELKHQHALVPLLEALLAGKEDAASAALKDVPHDVLARRGS